MVQTGTFPGEDAREIYYPLIVEKHGIRIALLNYTYGTNGIRDLPPAIVNRIDTVRIREDLQKALAARPDFILATLHWGNEYELTESPAQQKLADFLFSLGVDAVIGSHPHVVQPIRGSGTGSLVAYSLGNLISNQRSRYRDGGIIFEITLSKYREEPGGTKQTEITDHAYLPVWVWKPDTKKGTLFTLVPANLDTLSSPLVEMTAKDRSSMSLFLEDTRSRLKGNGEVITPLTGF